MFFSPLRYPGGKGKLEPFMELLIKQTGHFGGTYVEPFAGGAGIALELLEKEIVNEIVINDLDKGIYSFWRAILTETNRFIDDIRNVELTVNEWNRQRQVIDDCRRYSYELGFATFYMNRTNRSEHMYFAAMEDKSCKLTALGLHYWKLSKDRRF